MMDARSAGPVRPLPNHRFDTASGEYTAVSLLIPLVMVWIQVGLMREEFKKYWHLYHVNK